jgi:serine-type D-Ala-D-Ala carboxypeptidase
MNHPFGAATTYLQEVIDQRLIPGAVLRVERGGEVLLETALGLRHTAPVRPMETDTLFDIASLTKIVATLGTFLTLFDQGRLDPSQTLGEFIAVAEHLRPLTLAQCLTHTTGLPAIILLEHGLDEIDAIQFENSTGTRVVYSDIAFLLLGRVIEAVMGASLDAVVRERCAEWNMPDTGYNPADRERCAATEWRDHLGRHQLGEVHDENAGVLGGVAAQAGLFSTARDLAAYASLYRPPLATPWRDRSHECWTEGLDDRRGLGWQLWTPDCFAGPLASPASYGHTGYTGTSMWIDPAHDLVIILLTNRVHFGRQPHILAIRKRVHTLLYEVLTTQKAGGSGLRAGAVEY